MPRDEEGSRQAGVEAKSKTMRKTGRTTDATRHTGAQDVQSSCSAVFSLLGEDHVGRVQKFMPSNGYICSPLTGQVL